MNKTLSIFLLLLTVSMGAFAQASFDYNGIGYKVISEADRTVEVSSSDGYAGSELKIPEMVTYSGKEYTVTRIGESLFLDNKTLTSVSIPETVKTIGSRAFEYCNNLTSLTFEGESQLEQIDSYAFTSTGLTTVDVPASVINLGKYAFSDNTELRYAYMHRDDPSGYNFAAFDHCLNLVIYAPAALYETYKNLFYKNNVEVELTEWKTYALNTIEDGLNAVNTLSDEDRKNVNTYIGWINEAKTFDAAYVPFTDAMSIINEQCKMEKKLKDAISIFATRKNGPTIEIRANDGTTIKLYNIEKVNFSKEGE